ncbi:alpha/beta hydrolase [Corallococcus sp. BB11-1]|uniref:alpha/beta fold hydrolase n=1 Tax=Corallococcus sp. BB11-1 TaxID=2996783 RepID=UPI00226E3A71|nr:alpha/beta hydrolase [Corallococcus sp. BB11-1]MCY1032462.1 alpha/beta hydrolase [Corallococcus sp. BB11-1]
MSHGMHGVGEPERLEEARLPDGRNLGWAQWGPADGVPVLFFSGAAMGRSLGFGADVLARLGVRLISVDRPGLGASSPSPERTLNDWVTDIRHLASALALPRFGIVGFSQGAPFALACAAAGLPSAVAVVSGQDDLNASELAGMLHPDVAGMVRRAVEEPATFEATFAGMGNAEVLWKLITGTSSAVDLAVYTSPGFEPAYRRALEEGFSQGARGYARDLTLAMGRWPFDLGRIQVPVALWYGGHDTSIVHSPDHGAVLARRIPTASRHLLPEAGGSLLWTHAADILESLLRSGRH